MMNIKTRSLNTPEPPVLLTEQEMHRMAAQLATARGMKEVPVREEAPEFWRDVLLFCANVNTLRAAKVMHDALLNGYFVPEVENGVVKFSLSPEGEKFAETAQDYIQKVGPHLAAQHKVLGPF